MADENPDGALRDLGEGLYEHSGGLFVLSGSSSTKGWTHVGTIVVQNPQNTEGPSLARAAFRVNYSREGEWQSKPAGSPHAS